MAQPQSIHIKYVFLCYALCLYIYIFCTSVAICTPTVELRYFISHTDNNVQGICRYEGFGCQQFFPFSFSLKKKLYTKGITKL